MGGGASSDSWPQGRLLEPDIKRLRAPVRIVVPRNVYEADGQKSGTAAWRDNNYKWRLVDRPTKAHRLGVPHPAAKYAVLILIRLLGKPLADIHTRKLHFGTATPFPNSGY